MICCLCNCLRSQSLSSNDVFSFNLSEWQGNNLGSKLCFELEAFAIYTWYFAKEAESYYCTETKSVLLGRVVHMILDITSCCKHLPENGIFHPLGYKRIFQRPIVHGGRSYVKEGKIYSGEFQPEYGFSS